MPSYDGVVRPVSRKAVQGIPVWHQQYGWIMIEDDSYPVLPREIEEQRSQEIEKPPSAVIYAVRSKADIKANYLPDFSGKYQVFLQKEEDGSVDYVHFRQMDLKTGKAEMLTFKLVVEDDNQPNETPSEIETSQSPVIPGIPDGMVDLLIDAVANLNSKLESIDNGIKEMKTQNAKYSSDSEISDDSIHG